MNSVALTNTAATPYHAVLADYITLLKPRVMSLVVFVGLAGIVLAPGHLPWFLAFTAVLAIALSAGAAAAINMWYDRDIDAVMARTQNRPLPAGRMAPATALEFGVVLSVLATLLMTVATNWVAGLLLTLANLYYVFVYTIWLKRRTPQNIVIGGAAGAFPPMIGWAAVTGDITLASIALFAIIFMWTPPHFWALALIKREDYTRAGVPMLPNVAGDRHTKWQMFLYTLTLLPLSLAPFALGFAGMAYAAIAALLWLGFLGFALAVLLASHNRQAGPMFAYSIFYLFALFASLMLEHLLRGA